MDFIEMGEFIKSHTLEITEEPINIVKEISAGANEQDALLDFLFVTGNLVKRCNRSELFV
jgi:hypothetical protein